MFQINYSELLSKNKLLTTGLVSLRSAIKYICIAFVSFQDSSKEASQNINILHNSLTFNYQHYKCYMVRHLEGRYSKFELNYIKNICDNDLFPYYYFYCNNESLWQSIYEKLEYNECITDIINSEVEITLNKKKTTGTASMFVSSHNRYYFYQLLDGDQFEYIADYHFGDIVKCRYKIDPVNDNFENAVNARLLLEFANGRVIQMNSVSSFLAEKIHQKINCKNHSPDKISKTYLSKVNQIKKLNNLLRQDKICLTKYKTLCKKVSLTPVKVRKALWDKAFIQYLES